MIRKCCPPLFVLLFCALLSLLNRKYEQKANFFSLKAVYHFPPASSHESSDLYSYLSRGQQCFAFARENLVLKLFRKKEIPSLEIAIAHLFEECALVEIHLSPTPAPTVSLLTSNGFLRLIDLSRCSYIFQKKGEPLLAYLEQVIERNDVAVFRSTLEQTIALIVSTVQKGIGNRDPAIERNIGIVGDRITYFDIGGFYYLSECTANAIEEELSKTLHPLLLLIENKPVFSFHFEEVLKKNISNL